MVYEIGTVFIGFYFVIARIQKRVRVKWGEFIPFDCSILKKVNKLKNQGNLFNIYAIIKKSDNVQNEILNTHRWWQVVMIIISNIIFLIGKK